MTHPLAKVFKALSDETRLRIMNLIVSSGELCVCDIEEVLKCPQAKVSRHLAYLKGVGLVDARRQGLWMLYSVAQPTSDQHRELLECVMSLLKTDALAQKDTRQLMKNVEKGCCATFSVVKPGESPQTFCCSDNPKEAS
jgi:ArsR family transcriptional regulator